MTTQINFKIQESNKISAQAKQSLFVSTVAQHGVTMRQSITSIDRKPYNIGPMHGRANTRMQAKINEKSTFVPQPLQMTSPDVGFVAES